MIIYLNNNNNINLNKLKMEVYKLITSSEIYFSHGDDRHILIIKEGDEVVGLNYMQGDELEHFVEHYNDIDHDLTDFYNGVKYYLGGETELDRVNQSIWAYYQYTSLRDERETGYLVGIMQRK